MSLYKVLASLAVSGGGLFYYMGGFNAIEIKDSKLRSQIFLYKEQQSDYVHKFEILDSIKQDFMRLPTKDFTFTNVYIDNPTKVQNKNNERMIAGAMFDHSKKGLVKDFLREHQEYNMVETEDMDVAYVKFPFRGSFTYNFMGFLGLYALLNKYGVEKKNIKPEDRYIIEKYPYLNSGERVVEVMIPFGRNANQLKLTTLAAPPLKQKLPHAYYTP